MLLYYFVFLFSCFHVLLIFLSKELETPVMGGSFTLAPAAALSLLFFVPSTVPASLSLVVYPSPCSRAPCSFAPSGPTGCSVQPASRVFGRWFSLRAFRPDARPARGLPWSVRASEGSVPGSRVPCPRPSVSGSLEPRRRRCSLSRRPWHFSYSRFGPGRPCPGHALVRPCSVPALVVPPHSRALVSFFSWPSLSLVRFTLEVMTMEFARGLEVRRRGVVGCRRCWSRGTGERGAPRRPSGVVAGMVVDAVPLHAHIGIRPSATAVEPC